MIRAPGLANTVNIRRGGFASLQHLGLLVQWSLVVPT